MKVKFVIKGSSVMETVLDQAMYISGQVFNEAKFQV